MAQHIANDSSNITDSSPGFGWSHQTRGKCDCFVPNVVFDNSITPVPCPISLLHQLDKEFLNTSIVMNEYAILHPDALNGLNFLQPEPSKLAISSAIIKILFSQAKESWVNKSKQKSLDLNSETRAILLVSGDCYSAWNQRKRMFSQEMFLDRKLFLEAIRSETQFINLILSFRAKASNAWAHRRWVCDQANNEFSKMESSESEFESEFWKSEYDCCEAVILKQSRNYFAWNHRLWVSQRMMKPQRLLVELQWVNDYLSHNVSNRSAAHYSEQLIKLILSSVSLRTERVELLSVQIEQTKSLISSLPDHETLWHHLRSLLKLLLDSVIQDADLNIVASACKKLLNSEQLDLEDKVEGDCIHVLRYFEFCHSYIHHLTTNSSIKVSSSERFAVSAACDIYLKLGKQRQEGCFLDIFQEICTNMEIQRPQPQGKQMSHYCGEISHHTPLWRNLSLIK